MKYMIESFWSSETLAELNYLNRTINDLEKLKNDFECKLNKILSEAALHELNQLSGHTGKVLRIRAHLELEAEEDARKRIAIEEIRKMELEINNKRQQVGITPPWTVLAASVDMKIQGARVTLSDGLGGARLVSISTTSNGVQTNVMHYATDNIDEFWSEEIKKENTPAANIATSTPRPEPQVEAPIFITWKICNRVTGELIIGGLPDLDAANYFLRSRVPEVAWGDYVIEAEAPHRDAYE